MQPRFLAPALFAAAVALVAGPPWTAARTPSHAPPPATGASTTPLARAPAPPAVTRPPGPGGAAFPARPAKTLPAGAARGVEARSGGDASSPPSAVPGPPAVTPDAAPVQRTAGEPATEAFTVSNTGTDPAVYTLTVSCSPVASSCTSTRARLAVAGQASATVGVSYVTSGTVGATGTVRLVARDSATTAADSGWVQVSVIASRSTSYTSDVGAGVWLPRSGCLHLPAGLMGTYECGDLRLSYTLPATTVLGRTYAPTLLYSSANARPRPIVAAFLSPAAGTQPQSLAVTLRFEDNSVLTQSYPATGWAPGELRRVAVEYDAQTPPASGPLYVRSYTSQGTATFADGSTQVLGSGTGTMAVVNRRDSPFGNGWWLAGLEQLVGLADGTMLWVGGDGGTERYTRAAPGDSVWLGDALDGPDSLVTRTGLGSLVYERRLGGGAAVWFGYDGKHLQTCNRLKQCTVFEWTAGKLTRILLPATPSFNTYQAYVLTYGNPGGRLSQIDAPAGAGTRVTTFYAPDGRIQSIASPAQDTVGFGYSDATGVITSGRDPHGTVTSWRYGAGGKLTSSMVPVGTDSIAVRYTAQEALGLSGAVPFASVYTFFDGPRPDVPDYALFWADRRGMPWQVQDAMGGVTRVYRADPRWPALNTRVVYPNGRQVTATYDDAGRLTASTDWSVTAPDGRHATTLYEWDARWNAVTRVTRPEGEATSTGYDPVTGLRLWQQVGESSTRRVSFDYFPLNDASAPGLVRSVTHPLTSGTVPSVERYQYDARGNLSAVKSPLGFWSLTYRDALGRDTLSVTPIDTVAARDSATLAATGARQRTLYDLAGRDTLQQSIGPSTSYGTVYSGTVTALPAQTTSVRNVYDRGWLVRTDRWSTPDPNGIVTVSTRWRYDAAGRKVAEIAPAPAGAAEQKDSTRYDAAGNAVAVYTRRGHTLTMQYDALNRLTQRIIPPVLYANTSYTFSGSSVAWALPGHRDEAGVPITSYGSTQVQLAGDVETFTYDEMGNLRSAVNRDAVVRRGYYPNGALRADTLRIATYLARDTAQHLYDLHYQYDLDGRLVSRSDGGALQEIWGGEDYVYDPVTGALAEVRMPGSGPGESRLASFAYDADGQLTTLTRYMASSGTLAETWTHDADGRATHRTESSSAGGLIHDEAMAYDARGKLLTVNSPALQVRSEYDGLGALAHSYSHPLTLPGSAEEAYTLDALGNRLRSEQTPLDGKADMVPADWRTYRYEQGTGRLLGMAGRPETPSSLANRLDSTYYDAAGNITVTRATYPLTIPGVVTNGLLQAAVHQYYGADQRLRVVDRRACVFVNQPDCVAPDRDARSAFEEYRYDALGRRVLLRTRQEYGCTVRCNHSVTRFVWDGDQLLYEMRAPGWTGATAAQMEQDTGVIRAVGTSDAAGEAGLYGQVGYTHGPGLDQPLAIHRMNYDTVFTYATVLPHADWRGSYDGGTYRVSGAETHGRDGLPTYCVDVPWTTVDDSTVLQPPHSGSENPTGKEGVTHHCMDMEWPAQYMWVGQQNRRQTSQGITSWMGSLIDGSRDASGLMYRRNRMYDPNTGRFTQEDPIGLAGGLNAYGFANGDPVGYDDPYGLDPCKDPGSKDPVCETRSPYEFGSMGAKIINRTSWLGQQQHGLWRYLETDAGKIQLMGVILGGVSGASGGMGAGEVDEAFSTGWRPNTQVDLDWRGSGLGVQDALGEAFSRTGLDRSAFSVTRWGRDADGKSFPVEWRARGGAEVNIDLGHTRNGPGVPHVGYQTAGNRGSGGAVRGHILLDNVPVNR